jgi:hypothetical protein
MIRFFPPLDVAAESLHGCRSTNRDLGSDSEIVGAMVGYSPDNKRVSRLFRATTDGAKRRPLLGSNPNLPRYGSNIISGYAVTPARRRY